MFSSIKTRLSFIVSLLVATLVAGTALYALLYFERQTKKQVVSDQKNLVGTLANQLDDRIYSSQMSLKALAEILAPKVDDAAAVQRILNQHIDVLNTHNSLLLLSKKGDVVAATPEELNAPGANFAYREYFKNTLKTGTPQISRPFLSVLRPNRILIMFTQPVPGPGGTPAAVLGGSLDISSQNFLNNLARVKIGKKGYFSVYDATGSTLIHPDRTRILQMKALPVAARGLPEPAQSEEMDAADGERMIRTVGRLRSTGWAVAVSYPVAEAYRPIYTARRYFIGGGLLVVLLSGGVIWWAMTCLTRPLLALTEQIQGLVSTGGERCMVAMDREDEIGDLARAFNRLLSDLDRTAATLLESEAKYRQLFLSNPNPMWVYDCETLAFLNVNDAAVRHYGYSREEFLAMTIRDIRPVEDAPALLQRVAAVTEGLDKAGLWRHLKKDGTLIHVNITSHSIDYGGRAAEVVLADDVTERKTAEEALRESEERYRSIFEGVRDIIYTISPEGRFTSLNSEFERITGWGRGEWIGKSYDTLIHPEDRAAAVMAFEGRLHGEPGMQVRVRIRNRWGAYLTLELNSTNLLHDGRVLSVLGIARDITERRQAEAEREKLELQVRHMQKMEALGTLTGGVAHDFNNILGAIQGFANVMLNELADGSPHRHCAGQIITAAEKGTGLVRGLLAYSRKQPYAPKAVDVNDIVTGLTGLLARLLGEGIELETAASGKRLIVMADAGQIEQVLMNLAANARDAMSGSGVLSIAAKPIEMDEAFVRRHGYGTPGGYACLSVSDTGTGMDEKTMERIFEPFFTTKEVGKGTGLGLSILYGIVKQHEGYVTVSSEPGRGTSFRLYFPLAEEGDAKPGAHHRSALPPVTETILLIEENDEVRHMFRDILEKAGYRVVAAADGAEGIEAISQSGARVDLLIADAGLPGKSGGEIREAIQGGQGGMPVLYLRSYAAGSGDGEEDPEPDRFFVSKPVAPAALLTKVRGILDRATDKNETQNDQEP